jgi:hypothetical protein
MRPLALKSSFCESINMSGEGDKEGGGRKRAEKRIA